jgi:hypothetical protein
MAQALTVIADADAIAITENSCFSCGYPLHGLGDAATCPECGLQNETPQCNTMARTWLFQRWLTSRWLTQPGRTPQGLYYFCPDDKIRKRARRRCFIYLQLPCIFMFLLVGLSSLFEIERLDTSLWDRLRQSHPTPRVICEFRPFTLRVQIFPNYARITQSKDAEFRLKFSPITYPDLFMIMWIALPVFAWGANEVAFQVFIRRVRRPKCVSYTSSNYGAAICARILSAPLFGLALWIWVLAAIQKIVSSFLESANSSYKQYSAPLVAAAIVAWLLASAIGWPRLLRMDRRRIFLQSVLWPSILLIAIQVLLPPLVLYGVAIILTQ